MTGKVTVVLAGIVLITAVGVASANVLNMGGTRNPTTGQWTGLASLETVPVGNPGNAADTRIMSDGTTGYGTVDYNYRVGKYEVTAGQYCEFLNAVAGVDAYGLYNMQMWLSSDGCKIERHTGSGTAQSPYQYRVAADYANRPANFVSFGDACRFANWLHNGQPSGVQSAATTEDGAYCLSGVTGDTALMQVTRKGDWKWAVSSEDEWYKAAYHNAATGSYHVYPTNSDTAPGRDMNDASGNNANYYGDPFPVQSPYYTTGVGEFQNSDSPYGTFDQGGNVWEWNEAVPTDLCRGARGGAFNEYGSVNLDAIYRTFGDRHPASDYYNIGFRIVQVPEPTTLILVLGGAAILARYTRKSRP